MRPSAQKSWTRNIVPTVIVADDFPNFSICGLPYYISHEVADWRNLAHRTRQDIEDAGIRLMLGCTVTSVDHDNEAGDYHGRIRHHEPASNTISL